eukprot:PLAT1352.1.p1 GENE.PLAT1352.1~~PLAT1352.1.p1  ORF type:complete len:135 (+),score=35.94 PLAT1352.1:50-454(+)
MYADGASRGNPGQAGAGAVIYAADGADDVQTELARVSEYLGPSYTNNVAEYHSLLLGLRCALRLGVTALDVHMDSTLVVKQVRREYRVKAAHLVELRDEAIMLSQRLREFNIGYVPRELNSVADALANAAIDNK